MRDIAMSDFSAGSGWRGVMLGLCLAGLVVVSARADDAAIDQQNQQIQQILEGRCLKQGLLGQTPEQVKANCGCLAKVGTKHLQPAWRKAMLEGSTEQGIGPPMDDQVQFQIDALQTCPAIAPYQPKASGQ
jgi:hypothetical protein